MKTLGNILWHFPFLGFITASLTWLIGALLSATIIALPIGLGLMEYAKLLFWPFGNSMISKNQLNIKQNLLWKSYSIIITIIYLPFGLILLIWSIFQIITLFLSIIGIPIALVLVKSLKTILNPVNKICVKNAMVDEINRQQIQLNVENYFQNKHSKS